MKQPIGRWIEALILAMAMATLNCTGPAQAASVSVAEANNAFAFDLYGQLSQGAGNLFFSPYSIETALAMTYAGARGDTAAQMGAVLHLPASDPDLNKAFGDFLKDMNGADAKPRGYELSVANALWGQRGYSFLPGFTGMLQDEYGAGLRNVDFEKDAGGARVTINNWVAKATHDKITDLIPPRVLNGDTRLVLTNAIYFAGTWADKFEIEATKSDSFHTSTSDEEKVPMMHRTGKYGYAEGDGFQALKLPYLGNDLSMIVLLPRAVDGLPAVEKGLGTTLGNLDFSGKQVIVAMPKFKLTQEFGLGPVLQSMGMKDAFTPAADFSGMDGKKDFYISAVIHKAFVEVDEQGTKAAAATGVVMVAGVAMPISPPPVFRADHPFLFLIRQENTGAILFMGRVARP